MHNVKSWQPCHGAWGIPTSASEAKCLVFARLSFTWQYKALRVDDASHWTKCDLMPDQLGQRGM